MVKKVNAEVVDDFGHKVNKENKFLKNFKAYWFRAKLGIAILLDCIDLLIGWIPIANTIWDIICFFVLLLILKNKRLALFSLIEVPLIGLPPFSIIDMFLPICTIVVLIDNGKNNLVKVHSFRF